MRRAWWSTITAATPARAPIDGWGSSFAVWVYETHWWAHRALWHLIFSGALDRHPDLTVVFTEQGAGWIPATLDSLDVAAARYRATDLGDRPLRRARPPAR